MRPLVLRGRAIQSAMILIYNLLILILLPAAAGYLAYQRLLRRRYRESLPERFGLFRRPISLPDSCPAVIWIHAVSVGEVVAVTPLVKALRRSFPAAGLVVSTITETGQATARRNLPEADALLYFPLDLPWVVGKFIRRVRPSLFVFVETEIWPNFLCTLARRGIPAVLVNGRISRKSFQGYKWLSFFFRRVLAGVVVFSVRTETDRSRLIDLGLDAERVVTTGNMKYDQAVQEAAAPVRQIRMDLKLPEGCRLIVAGSTHEGEEEALADCYRRLSAENPDIRMMIAPRHLERVEDVEKVLRARGLSSVRKTKIQSGDPSGIPPGAVILLDTLGELQQMYRGADLAFVGGSLVPIGGHNVMEAAAWARPVLFGPYMENFADIAALLVERGGAQRVSDAPDLCHQISRLLQDPLAADEMGRRAKEVILQQRGAVERNLELIRGVIGRIGGGEVVLAFDGSTRRSV